MAKPEQLTANIFLDSGNPEETKEALKTLGFLDGQTTNPSLVTKSPRIMEKLAGGAHFSESEAISAYRSIIEEISNTIPDGYVSVEVYADATSTTEQLLTQGRSFYTWAPNLHVKLPCTKSGIETAAILVKEGVRVNMTLCFSLEQAAAVHVATLGCTPGQVYISPFVGRLEDRGLRGMDLISNLVKWYKQHNSNVSVLAASIRSREHMLAAIQKGADIITAPLSVLTEWHGVIPDPSFVYADEHMTGISYEDVPLSDDWHSYNIQHDLTDSGLQKFADDWNRMIGK